MKKPDIYSYVDRKGTTRDLSSWLDDPSVTKEFLAAEARRKGRIHDLARAMDSMRSAGYSANEIRQVTDWILSGRALAGIGG